MKIYKVNHGRIIFSFNLLYKILSCKYSISFESLKHFNIRFLRSSSRALPKKLSYTFLTFITPFISARILHGNTFTLYLTGNGTPVIPLSPSPSSCHRPRRRPASIPSTPPSQGHAFSQEHLGCYRHPHMDRPTAQETSPSPPCRQ